jgi:hypothetical protein
MNVWSGVTENNLTDDDHADGMILRLWTAATNEHIVRPPGHIWEWRMMPSTEKTDSSTRSLWQSYQQSSGSKQEEWEEEIKI